MSYSHETISHYRNAWRERAHQRTALNEKRRQQALVEAKRVAGKISQHAGVRKLVLFGSTLLPGRFCERSDIDLGVWGLEPGEYFRVLAQIERECSFPVDLIPAEDARPAVQRNIERGEVLYERKGD